MISDDHLRALRAGAPKPSWTEDAATEPQINYIKGLVKSRDIPAPWLKRAKELVDEGLTKGKAGEIISAFKKCPVKPAEDNRSINKPSVRDIPVGRYCVQTGEDANDLSFFRVKDVRGGPEQDGGYRLMLRIAGPNEYPVTGQTAREAAKLIVRMGIGNAAALYGHKVGRCSICHTQITNRVSRELGIGPVCGGRVYGDWEERVNKAVTSLRSRGLDPHENV